MPETPIYSEFFSWSKLGSGAMMRVGDSYRSVIRLEPVKSKANWNELVISWNAETPPGSYFWLYARGIYSDHETEWFQMGTWSQNQSLAPRESTPGQKDGAGDVATDTLILSKPGAKFELQIVMIPNSSLEFPKVHFLSACVVDRTVTPPRDVAYRKAWNQVLAVPEHFQGDYPNGKVLCSPTCVSMILAYWSRILKKLSLDKTVPEVAEGVYDRNWPGTGNWPFNTAYAGSLPGIRAYVARLGGLDRLERWLDASVPVACSVSNDMLKGKDKRGDNDGHLVVVAGFDEKGDVIANDPGRKQVRQTYPRSAFEKAWAASGNTVYLIYPEDWKIPKNSFGEWAGQTDRQKK